METSFWLQKWQQNEIAFHEHVANPALVKHVNKLALKKDSRVFLPLCGKTLDIAWLLSKDYRIVGAELSQTAIKQLFIGLSVKPNISKIGELNHYSAKNIDIFVGDVFNLSQKILGDVDAVYDRAALIALPPETRHRYTQHLMKITNKAPQLLLSVEYNQKLMAGPPFSVSNDEVIRHYAKSYTPTLLSSTDIPGGIKGKFPAKANVWLLQKKIQT